MGVGVITAMITIRNDGTIEPLGLKILRESKLQLTAPTRDIKDSSDEFDGEIDFGAELKCGHWMLVGITDEGLNTTGKMQIRRNIAGHLNNLRNNGYYLAYESDPVRKIFVQLEGRAEVEEYPSWLKVNIPLKVDPLWVSAYEMVAWNNQQAAVGMGDSCNPEHTSPAVVVNMGTLETPIIVELKGPATNPEITIGNEALKYFGALTAGDTLIIDTDRKTVKFNGVNALANYSGGFPQIPPGQTTVFYDGDGILTLKWHDRWI